MGNEHSQDLLSAYSKNQLIGASAWARILGIIGFVFAGLLVCLALFVMSGGMGSIMGANMPEGATTQMLGKSGMVVGLLYLLIAGIYFLMSWWTYRFGTEIKKGIMQNDPEEVGSSFHNLKNYFQAYGILTMIGVGIMFLSLLSVLMIGFFN